MGMMKYSDVPVSKGNRIVNCSIKKCPDCDSPVPSHFDTCPKCDYVFDQDVKDDVEE